jgi:hypothetical protein
LKRIALPLIAVLALAGCASSPAAEPSATPTPTTAANPNAEACDEFATVTEALADRMVEGSNSSNADEFMTTMDGMPARFDSAGLAGDGDVSERIAALIDNLPDPVHMLYLEHDDYFDDVTAVSRACEAEGFPVDAYTWG